MAIPFAVVMSACVLLSPCLGEQDLSVSLLQRDAAVVKKGDDVTCSCLEPSCCRTALKPKYCDDFLSNSGIFYDRGNRPLVNPRTALFATLVQTADHYKEENMVEDALAMFRSSREVGSELPMHLIAGALHEEDVKRFTELGVVVEDYTHLIDTVKGWWKPMCSIEQGPTRIWLEGNSVQCRPDGWPTYFKFLAWNSSYDVVLHVDLDFQFRANPDDLVHAAADAGLPFLTCPEVATRRYDGFNTHGMILQPSARTFERIVRKASAGDYVPFTNTEQDVLECFFRVEDSAASAVNDLHRAFIERLDCQDEESPRYA